ncbi:MAG: 50S ribosomal protein L9 [bacterium]
MEIILLERIQNLGELGDTVRVANGYARNFLIPQKKAVRATAEAKAQVEARRVELAQEESKRREVAQARADLAPREISLTRLVSESGTLYGSVAPADIAEAMTETMTEVGARIEKSEIILPAGPIKQPGISEVEIVLHAEVRFAVRVTVLADAQSPLPAVVVDDATDDAPSAQAEETSVQDSANASAQSSQPSQDDAPTTSPTEQSAESGA